MKTLVCYCFNYSEHDIMGDVAANGGASLILKKIMASKKTGKCRCEKNHPEKR